MSARPDPVATPHPTERLPMPEPRSDDESAGPFSAALARFDPSAEPFANMTPGRVEQVRAGRLADRDVAGYWEAELHLAEKMAPMERYIHDLGLHLYAWLHIME